MAESEKQLREELTEAINKVRRELEILRAPSSIVADLEKELRRLLEARADL
jgi:hypothetical protein